ncbi:YceD family protein [Phaeovulum sp.]|uniref:YceD family protein n=1 Tax=Phaeovulum sp. TaxID=2934796 RepID=UPI00272EF05C|nr:YceD family protein [Phaeovulum sp.]MDP1670369.1 YceD family protein [Phaeovulum sp.]MDZ4120698.1 YceD family protein [Phaeovulum sp.]
MPDLPPPFSYPLRLSDLAQRKPTRFALAPDAETRRRIAEWAGIEALPRLRFAGALSPRGRRDWQLEAELDAVVVQACVVTLAPVSTKIAEPVARRWLADLPAPVADEAEIPEDVSTEALPEVIDLGAVMLEALELALPLYPRAPGAEFGAAEVTEAGLAPMRNEAPRPFAGLAAMLKGKAGDSDRE